LKQPPLLLWLCIAYLLASVAFNVWTWAPVFQSISGIARALLLANLVCKFVGAILLIFRLRAGMYFLIFAFLAGLADEARSIAADGWRVPLTLARFTIPLLVILYCVRLSQRGVIIGLSARLREKQVEREQAAQTFE
jgi:hypothetical protein